jgi:hypothetical protein
LKQEIIFRLNLGEIEGFSRDSPYFLSTKIAANVIISFALLFMYAAYSSPHRFADKIP